MITYPIAIDDVTTRVIESGSGPAVLLLHGLGTRADRWRSNIPGLASVQRRVIAVDLPGHGFAQKGPGFDYSVSGYARFVRGLMKVLDVDRATLVGASLGGQIAATLAGKNPELVDRLVLVGSTGLVAFGAETRANMSKMLVDMSREAIRTRLERGIRNLSLITDELVEEDFRVNNSPGAADAFDALGRYFADRIDNDIVLDALISISDRIPVLLVWGTEDLSVPLTVAADTTPKIRGARLMQMAGTAHNPYFDKPDEFNRILREFLDDAGLAEQQRLVSSRQ
jgi:pimeloyl-ACP methyl ester carboxylesterase